MWRNYLYQNSKKTREKNYKIFLLKIYLIKQGIREYFNLLFLIYSNMRVIVLVCLFAVLLIRSNLVSKI